MVPTRRHESEEQAPDADRGEADGVLGEDDIYRLLLREADKQANLYSTFGTLDTAAMTGAVAGLLRNAVPETFPQRSKALKEASKAFRKLLVRQADAYARPPARSHGGAAGHESSRHGRLVLDEQGADLLRRLGAALERLRESEPRLSDVADCRLFGRMSFGEIGAALDVSARTARAYWALAQVRLFQDMAAEGQRRGAE